jgi:hypothetical protein
MDKIINWFKRLANDPSRSWAFFKRGLGIFCSGAVVVLIGAKFAPIIQIPGLVLLAVGSVYSIRGYLGILLQRMTNSFKAPPSQFDKDK